MQTMIDTLTLEDDPYEVVSYFVTDDQNLVVLSGSCQKMHLQENAAAGTLHMGTAPQGRFKFIKGEFVPYAPEISYDLARRGEYPSIEEQLDMLWHAMEQGATPKSEPFYSTLQKVKQQYPKA